MYRYNFFTHWKLTEMVFSKYYEDYSTAFGFQKTATMCSYKPKKDTAAFVLSSIHIDVIWCDEPRKNPEIIKYYNLIKGSIGRRDHWIKFLDDIHIPHIDKQIDGFLHFFVLIS